MAADGVLLQGGVCLLFYKRLHNIDTLRIYCCIYRATSQLKCWCIDSPHQKNSAMITSSAGILLNHLVISTENVSTDASTLLYICNSSSLFARFLLDLPRFSVMQMLTPKIPYNKVHRNSATCCRLLQTTTMTNKIEGIWLQKIAQCCKELQTTADSP